MTYCIVPLTNRENLIPEGYKALAPVALTDTFGPRDAGKDKEKPRLSIWPLLGKEESRYK